MHKILQTLVALAAMTGLASAQPGAAELDAAIARAEAQTPAPAIDAMVRATLHRARRSIAIGPTVGVWSAAILDPGDVDAALTFGLGVELFKVPVAPSIERIRELIVERTRTQLRDRIATAFAGRQPAPLELDQLVRQVYDDVRNELVGDGAPKTMERPRLTLGFEANRLFGAERWLGRTRVGIGVWKLTLGVSAAVGRVCRGDLCDPGVKLFSGPELVLHFLTSKRPRASVVDAFVRFNLQATGRGTETYDQLVLGARFLVDAI